MFTRKSAAAVAPAASRLLRSFLFSLALSLALSYSSSVCERARVCVLQLVFISFVPILAAGH